MLAFFICNLSIPSYKRPIFLLINTSKSFKILNGNGRNVLAKTSGNSNGLDGTPGQLNGTDFDNGEAERSGPLGSMWGTAKGNYNGTTFAGWSFYPSGGDSDTIKNQRFSLSRAIDFASIDTTNDTFANGVGPKAFAGNMTNVGWQNSAHRREALWNQTNGFWNYRMMDKTLGVVGPGNGQGDNVNNGWGSFSQSATPKKRRHDKENLQETIHNFKMWLWDYKKDFCGYCTCFKSILSARKLSA